MCSSCTRGCRAPYTWAKVSLNGSLFWTLGKIKSNVWASEKKEVQPHLGHGEPLKDLLDPSAQIAPDLIRISVLKIDDIVEKHPLHLVEVIVLLEGLTTSWRPHCRHPRLRDGKDGHMYKRNQTHLISQTLRVSHVDQPLSPLNTSSEFSLIANWHLGLFWTQALKWGKLC